MVVSVTDRDSAAIGASYSRGAPTLETFACALRGAGMTNVKCRDVSEDDVANLGSSWAKRLGIPRRRPAWVLTARGQVL